MVLAWVNSEEQVESAGYLALFVLYPQRCDSFRVHNRALPVPTNIQQGILSSCGTAAGQRSYPRTPAPADRHARFPDHRSYPAITASLSYSSGKKITPRICRGLRKDRVPVSPYNVYSSSEQVSPNPRSLRESGKLLPARANFPVYIGIDIGKISFPLQNGVINVCVISLVIHAQTSRIDRQQLLKGSAARLDHHGLQLSSCLPAHPPPPNTHGSLSHSA